MVSSGPQNGSAFPFTARKGNGRAGGRTQPLTSNFPTLLSLFHCLAVSSFAEEHQSTDDGLEQPTPSTDHHHMEKVGA